MALTDIAIRKIKPSDKPFKKADRDGLYLYVVPKGTRYWRCDYQFAGKRRTASLGVYTTRKGNGFLLDRAAVVPIRRRAAEHVMDSDN